MTYTLDSTYEVRLLRAHTTDSCIKAETYVLHPIGEPGRGVAQLDLFQSKDGAWSFWEGPSWRYRVQGKRLAALRNANAR